MYRPVMGLAIGFVMLVLSSPVFAEEEALGKVLYQAYCVICHGPSGKGNGFSADALIPGPPDFSDEEFKASANPDALREVILNGKPETQMEGFEKQVSSEEAGSLVEHIMSY